MFKYFTLLCALAGVSADLFCRINHAPVDATETYKVNLNGLEYSLKDDFLVVSYGPFSFSYGEGDIEGRLAFAQTANLGAGSSIGAGPLNSLNPSNAQSLPYSIIGNGALTWSTGELYPDSSSALPQENGCVGNTDNVWSYLKPRFANSPACTDEFATTLTQSKNYFSKLSSDLAFLTPNTVSNVEWSTLTIDCAGHESATQYVASFTGAQLNSVTTVRLAANCNPDAEYILNIGGSGDIFFTGDQFMTSQATFDPYNLPYVSDVSARTLINVIGSGRTIFVGSLYGNILAPENNINSTGTIYGHVIANTVEINQVNLVDCNFTPTPIVTTAFEDTVNPVNPPRPCVDFPFAIDAHTTTVALHIPLDVPKTLKDGGVFAEDVECIVSGTLSPNSAISLAAEGFTYDINTNRFECTDSVASQYSLVGDATAETTFSFLVPTADCKDLNTSLKELNVLLSTTTDNIAEQARFLHESIKVTCNARICPQCAPEATTASP